MGSILKVGALVYFIYKAIVNGREYFASTSVQNDSEPTEETKELRDTFIWNIAGAVILFLATLGIDIPIF